MIYVHVEVGKSTNNVVVNKDKINFFQKFYKNKNVNKLIQVRNRYFFSTYYVFFILKCVKNN